MRLSSCRGPSNGSSAISGVMFMDSSRPMTGGTDVYFREGHVGVSGLVEGMCVEVEVEQSPQGRRARGVRVMD